MLDGQATTGAFVVDQADIAAVGFTAGAFHTSILVVCLVHTSDTGRARIFYARGRKPFRAR